MSIYLYFCREDIIYHRQNQFQIYRNVYHCCHHHHLLDNVDLDEGDYDKDFYINDDILKTYLCGKKHEKNELYVQNHLYQLKIIYYRLMLLNVEENGDAHCENREDHVPVPYQQKLVGMLLLFHKILIGKMMLLVYCFQMLIFLI